MHSKYKDNPDKPPCFVVYPSGPCLAPLCTFGCLGLPALSVLGHLLCPDGLEFLGVDGQQGAVIG